METTFAAKNALYMLLCRVLSEQSAWNYKNNLKILEWNCTLAPHRWNICFLSRKFATRTSLSQMAVQNDSFSFTFIYVNHR